MLNPSRLPRRATCKLAALAALATAQDSPIPSGPTVLEANKPLVRSLQGGETHSYRIATTNANEFLSLLVDQRGVDVVLSVHSPDGVKLAEADGPNHSVSFWRNPVHTV